MPDNEQNVELREMVAIFNEYRKTLHERFNGIHRDINLIDEKVDYLAKKIETLDARLDLVIPSEERAHGKIASLETRVVDLEFRWLLLRKRQRIICTIAWVAVLLAVSGIFEVLKYHTSFLKVLS